MDLNIISCKCPGCMKMNRERCNSWFYGSPIRRCKYCGMEYLDKRWREVALQGVDPRSENSTLYLVGTIFFGIITLVLLNIVVKDLTVENYFAWDVVMFMAIAVMGTIISIVMFIRIITGIEARTAAKYMAESERRLRNPEYANKLATMGYRIPDIYKN